MSLRRDLKFSSLDEILGELNRLDRSGVQTVGKWSYYQILDHIAGAVENSMSSYPRRLPAFVRKTIGPLAFRHMVKKGVMNEGNLNPDAPKQREEGDAAAAMQRLKNALTKFKSYEGPVAEHPFFGTLSRSDFNTLHTLHAALHLSFVHLDDSVPRSAPGFAPAPARGGTKKSAKKTSTNGRSKPAARRGTAVKNSAGKKTAKKAVKGSAKKSVTRLAKKASKKGRR